MGWAAKDLPLFTPASAPILPAATLAKYESAVAAAQPRSSIASATAGQTPDPTGLRNGPEDVSHDQSSRLSTGEKIGIGVGVGVGVAALLLLATVFMLVRKTKRTRGNQNPKRQRRESRWPYLDLKAELDASRPNNIDPEELPDPEPRELVAEERPQELAAEGQSREVAVVRGWRVIEVDQEPPPVPFASKPRFHEPGGDGTTHELE